MTEDELKYTLYLLDGLNEGLIEEVLQFYYEISVSKQCKEFSDELIDFFRKNLKSNPVTTTTVLSYFQNHLKNRKIQELFISVLDNHLSDANSIEKLISLISLIRFEDEHLPNFIDKILKPISESSYSQHRKQVLISLISHQKPELIRIYTEHMRQNEKQKEFKLTPEYMLELCYLEKTHWLLKAAHVYKQQLHDMKKVTFKINNFTKQILIMVLIDLVNNQDNYDLPGLVNQMTNIFTILNTYTSFDKQLQFYVMEIKRELTIIKFCLENKCKLISMSAFSQALMQSAISVISQLCNLSRLDRYKVSRILNTNNDTLNELKTLTQEAECERRTQNINWDMLTYNSYCAITQIIDIIMKSTENIDDNQEISSALEETKRLILSLQPISYCIEIIENVFSCLFLRYEYFSCEEHSKDFSCGTHSDCSYFFSKKLYNKNLFPCKNSSVGFICNSVTTQMILNILKGCLDTLEERILTKNINPDVTRQFKDISKIVNHSIWKLQLVSTLSMESNVTTLKLCLDYDVFSSEDEGKEDLNTHKKKFKTRRRHTNPKSDSDGIMFASTISSNNDDVTSTIPTSSNEFISLMLANPNCLVALALHHTDFSKANQIIEMFDLADADIATEVTFTEKYRQLVAKIKNLHFYKDLHRHPLEEISNLSVVSTEVMSLVEAFLSSNRATTSLDIMELARRHPHLQLYSLQNSALVSAVDILLSTGLNREVSYGLINVVERKLAEVRSSIEISTPKKGNYIRFVEDIANVSFEIFGDSEKAFQYVNDICGIINDCRVPLKHKEFCKLNQLAKELTVCTSDLAEIVEPVDSSTNKNILQRYHQTYMNVVAVSDKDICDLESCFPSNKKTRNHYLRTCYIYCKNIALLEVNDDKPSNDSHSLESTNEAPYFSVLEKQLHDTLGTLIYDKKLPINELEPICKKVNINLIHKVILNVCPVIPLTKTHKEATEANFNILLQAVYDFENTDENLFLDISTNFASLPRPLDKHSLTYIVLHNWVLAHIIKKVHAGSPEYSLQQSIDDRTKFVNNYMDLKRFDCLKIMFGGNRYLAALYSTIDLDNLFSFMLKLIESGKIMQCLHVIDALSETQLLCSANLMNLRDLVLFKLAIHPRVEANWKYSQHLKCPELKVNLILNNLRHWPVEGAMELLDYLKFLLDEIASEDGLYDKCKDWMNRIPLYDQIASITGSGNWYKVYEASIESPEEIIEALMESQQFKLCLEWADIHEVSENMKCLIVTNLLRQLFEYTSEATPLLVKELLDRLPVFQAIDLIHQEMSNIRNVEILQICIDFISENSSDWKAFENIKIGLQIMLEIDLNLRHLFWEIIERPLLMIEQFLMNARLDTLANIISRISINLKSDPTGDNLYYNMKSIEKLVISTNALDALLRFYAEKALDMKNPQNKCPSPPKPTDEDLLQSIDSINITDSSHFVMPETVPSKEEWVKDYYTDRCMLCHISIFSMIIRRHHCRRCGRLVCHACSRHRMQVPTYPPDVKFRVCDDCYTQTVNRKSSSDKENAVVSSGSDSAGSGTTCMDWCLSANAKRNDTIRNEFSFEFTPNVTLCLSIMKMHTINLDCPRFLLDRSDEVARELANGGDARLLVRTRRSLLLAAAELYSRAPHDKMDSNKASQAACVAEAGAAHAARCLAHADAMAILVKHACHHLLPQQGAHPSHIVRSLLEAEKWELALEIVTKSGLPRNSVLAAWGKACLKAGRFKQAREKFAHCFRSTFQVSNLLETLEECEYGREASEVSPLINRSIQRLRYSERSSSMSSLQSDGRPRSNPPLLNEIISILEDMNYPVNQQLLAKAETIKSTNEKLVSMNNNKKKITLNEPALNIMHALATVKKIKQGDYSDFHLANAAPKKNIAQGLLRRTNSQSESKQNNYKKLDPFFYRECVYYLSSYGSHVANINFYMNHCNMVEVLKYCYDNIVDRDIFTEYVFMECLKKDKVNELVHCMSDKDSTLEMWADYITHTCRTLEAGCRLEALYAFQCGTGQHARAAATCARLYARNLPRDALQYATLHARAHHLAAATHHLAQCVPVTHKTSSQKSFHLQLDKSTIEKHLTTISRQMEVAKFLAACESDNRLTSKMITEVMPLGNEEGITREYRPLTLFGSNTDRMRLAALILVSGQTVEDGFNLAFKLISENKLDSMKIYTHTCRYLVHCDRFLEVKALAKCVRNSKETGASLMSDQLIEVGVSAVVARCEARGQLHDEQAEILIEDIQSVSIKISCYLECKILTTAYIMAVRHDRTNDLRRILREAERLGNDQIRNACIKRLTVKNVM